MEHLKAITNSDIDDSWKFLKGYSNLFYSYLAIDSCEFGEIIGQLKDIVNSAEYFTHFEAKNQLRMLEVYLSAQNGLRANKNAAIKSDLISASIIRVDACFGKSPEVLLQLNAADTFNGEKLIFAKRNECLILPQHSTLVLHFVVRNFTKINLCLSKMSIDCKSEFCDSIIPDYVPETVKVLPNKFETVMLCILFFLKLLFNKIVRLIQSFSEIYKMSLFNFFYKPCDVIKNKKKTKILINDR